MKPSLTHTLPITAILVSVFFFSGCATAISPDSLQTPQELACVYLKEPLALTDAYGPLNFGWTTRLERGPYWSEKIDEQGTYYRAPPGGISVTSKDGASFPGQPATLDGGFYVPNNPAEPVSIYRYFSTAAATVKIAPIELDCSTMGYVKDPATSKISLVAFATDGAIDGGTGGIIGRSIADGSKLSYGQAAGIGAAGGLVGGLVIASMINADVGKIVSTQPPVKDKQFLDTLKTMAANKVVIKQFQIP
jgi:hypothetical protein